MDPSTHPDTMTGRISARKVVLNGLMEVTERQREILWLYYFYGYTLREISTRRKESLGNTRHHFYRGIENLRKAVVPKPYGKGQRC